MQEISKNNLNLRDIKLPSRTPTRGKDTIINKNNPIEIPKIQNFTGKIYKIRSVPILPDSKYVSRTCPKKIVPDKERLYEENLNLKQMYNFINQENLKMRTKIQLLEKNAEATRSQEASNLNYKNSHLVDSLKNSVKDLRTEIKSKDKEIEDMKRYIRYTKMQELEADLLQYQSECTRLKEIIDELLKKQDILPDGIEAYEDLKREVIYLRKMLNDDKKLRESGEKKESLEIEEPRQEGRLGKDKIEEKNDDLLKLELELESKDQRIKELEQENKRLLELAHEKSGLNSPLLVNSPKPQLLFTKIQNFLSSHHISSASWVKSITSNPSLSLPEFRSALEQDLIEANQEEIQDFWQKYSKNNQISSQVLISLYEGEEIEKLSISQIFEVFKAKATLSSIQDIQQYLESELAEPVITETDFYQLCSKPTFLLESSQNIQTFAKFILQKSSSKGKEEVIESILQGFSNWMPLTKAQIEGILNRFKTLVFDCYEELISRIQEKTRFQSVIAMEDLIKEFRLHGIIDSDSEETCARGIIFYVSGSVKRVVYLKVVQLMYEGNFEDEFLKELKEEEKIEDMQGFSDEHSRESARLGDSLPRGQDFDSAEESEKDQESSKNEENKENDYKGLNEDEDQAQLSDSLKQNKSIILQSEVNDIEEVQLSEGLRNKAQAAPAIESSSSTIRKSSSSSSSSSSSPSSSSSSSHSSRRSSHNSSSLKF